MKMTVLRAGDKVRLKGLVHEVVDVGIGQKTDGSVDFYSYRIKCSEIPIHVVFEDRVRRARGKLNCLACIAGDASDADYNT